jgi:hypothetical protein
MIVRLLVVVLTLIGAVPIRICTCGAAHHHDSQPLPELPAGVGADPAHEHHDADCHAVKPRPLMSIGLTCTMMDPTTADCLAAVLPEAPHLKPAPGHAIRDVHPPPGRCDFLSYTVLRI